MNVPINPIDNLRDIHLPTDPGVWPPAIGWWVIAFLLVFFLFKVGEMILRWYRLGEKIRRFRTQVMAISVDSLNSPAEKQSAIASLSSLVKQLCIHLLGRSNVAATHGHSWLTLLDKLTASNRFSNGPGQLLAEGAYRKNIDGDVIALKNTILETLGRRSVLKMAKEVTVNECW